VEASPRLLTGPRGGWIRDHYAEPMRISDLARLAGMSPYAVPHLP
jgi:AraC-like DNA-binding protein